MLLFSRNNYRLRYHDFHISSTIKVILYSSNLIPVPIKYAIGDSALCLSVSVICEGKVACMLLFLKRMIVIILN